MSDKGDNNNIPLPLNKLLTGEEVAEILNVSRSFAYRLMRRGDIPTIRMGRAVRVRIEDLELFITNMVMNSEKIEISNKRTEGIK